jgi:hypothetical protein
MTTPKIPSIKMHNGVELPLVGYGTWQVRHLFVAQDPSFKNCNFFRQLMKNKFMKH